jgi:hypothetical protein
VRNYLVAGVLMFMAGDSVLADCVGNTQTTIVFGNGILTTQDDAQFSLDWVLSPAVLQAIGTRVDSSCIGFALAYDSLFLNGSNQAIIDIENFFPQLADAFAQRGIDFAANFWNYWTLTASPPSWFQSIQQEMILSATSVFQPDLLTQESFYNTEIGLGHNIIVVAHSQGNLYVNQAYAVVTSLGGANLFHVVGVATPATYVAGSGPYFTLQGDIITIVPGSLTPDIINDPPSPCPSSVSILTLAANNLCHSFDSSYMDLSDGDKTRPAIVNAVIGFLPSPAISVVPSPYDFGPVVLGSSGQKNFTVQNTGNATLSISNMTSSPGFSLLVAPFPITVVPGATATFTASFFPGSTLGLQQGTINIYSNAPGSPTQVSTSGTGVNIAPPPPTCTLSANPTTINQGQSSTLSWTTANNPPTASIDNGVGAVNTAGGNTNVSPTATTNYTLTVQNAGGTAACSATVTVNPPVSQLTWTQKLPAISPPARYGHAMAYDAARGQVVLFGGFTTTGRVGDTWVWDGSNWTQRFPPVSPPAMAFHGMAYDAARGQVVLFGSDSEPSAPPIAATWVWDGTTWIQKFPATSPTPRSYAALVYDSGRAETVLFSGAPIINNVADTWVWDGTSWTQKFPPVSPPARYGHAMAYDSGHTQTVLFGGITSLSIGTNDTWVWDGISWLQTFPATSPGRRYFHEMAYDSGNTQTVMFGGIDVSSGPTEPNDTWTWDGTTWAQATPITSSASTPEGRTGSAIAYDSAHRQVVLFGGQTSSAAFRNDTWVLGLP